MATIYDIAKLCQTSAATVSYVLNGRGDERRISKATQEKILAAAEALNYRPNTNAKRLSTDSPQQLSIALYWPWRYFEQPMIAIMRAVNQVTQLLSEPLEVNIQFYQPGTLPERRDALSSQLYAGQLIAGASQSDMEFLSGSSFLTPTVLVNRTLPGYPCVTIDHRAAGRRACELIAAIRPQTVATVWEHQFHVATNARKDAFAGRWAELGLSAENSAYFCEASAESGYELGIKLVQKKLVSRAIFCNQEEIARGLLAALNEFGVAVGRDTLLLTTTAGPASLCRFTSPSLSTIDLKMQSVASEALKLCLNLISRRGDPKAHIVLQPEVAFRDSFPEPGQTN